VTERVLKYGVGYHLVVVEETLVADFTPEEIQRSRLVLGIRCLRCARVSFHPKDVEERYCGACHVFHEDGLFSHEG
jgi:hypothetical protein